MTVFYRGLTKERSDIEYIYIYINCDHLIFLMGIPILVSIYIYIYILWNPHIWKDKSLLRLGSVIRSVKATMWSRHISWFWRAISWWQPELHNSSADTPAKINRKKLSGGNQSSWGPNKMADNLQTTLSKAFCWMKIIVFWFEFHWSLFHRFSLTMIISQH